ncbi:TRAFAC clade GTPase domain-containing protein [Phyllobacterium chamaecytisi]|uniref:TRAFAC clade GTPase domain-containing protein n=1 Tax=Phyllobacterium chamaecytisi TaxID=2876082 RepID=UPI001CCFAF11|nr:GTPase domain-containing protein [Phyllobacterium sp. KW56]MBZ9603341.1 hypothetical protein [Phyllobacterium sp. KW56]
MGHVDLHKCPIWAGNLKPPSKPADVSEEVLLPWSGEALGLADLAFVAGRARPMMVGVVGPQNAGKTTLLASLYLLVGRHGTGLEDRQFAGSFSLAGWEAVSSALRWDPGHPPDFPPHTASRGGRAPGFLHTRFRSPHSLSPADYVFADAPGEWFQRWAVNRDSVEGAGALWLSDHADIFLLVADREALSGETRGAARNAFRLLARRVGDELRGRPVALVWTKSDIDIDDAMEQAVRSAVVDVMPNVAEFSVSIMQGDSVPETSMMKLFQWILKERRPLTRLPQPTAQSDDPLFLFGGAAT